MGDYRATAWHGCKAQTGARCQLLGDTSLSWLLARALPIFDLGPEPTPKLPVLKFRWGQGALAEPGLPPASG